jgi:hypothetical protein
MSAYKVKNGGIILEYGFNPVTKVYGYSLTDLALKRVILSSNTQSGLTNIELAEKMRTFNAPKEHILRVLTNKPI